MQLSTYGFIFKPARQFGRKGAIKVILKYILVAPSSPVPFNFLAATAITGAKSHEVFWGLAECRVPCCIGIGRRLGLSRVEGAYCQVTGWVSGSSENQHRSRASA